MISHARTTKAGKRFRLDRAYADVAPWVILIKTAFDIETVEELADIDEADYDGYARQRPTVAPSGSLGNGDASALTAAITFTHDGGPTANDIHGMAVVDHDGGFGTQLLEVIPISPPITMEVNGDNISRQFRFLQGQYPMS